MRSGLKKKDLIKLRNPNISQLFPLSLCFDSFNAKAKSCCNSRFQTDSIISPIWKLFWIYLACFFKTNLDLFDSLHSCADLHHWLYESIPCYKMINVSIFSLYNMLYRSQFSHMYRDSGVDKNHLVHVCNRWDMSQDIHASDMSTCTGTCRIKW